MIEVIADFRAWCASASGWAVPSFCAVAWSTSYGVR
jgi:hypothetical protein